MFHSSFVVLGYLFVTLPWFTRNVALTGAPLPPAGTQTLWLRDYDDLFCYNCALSLNSYLEWGWAAIIDSKLWAAGINLQRFWAENGLIVLLPFTLVGLYRLRRRLPISLSILALGLIYLAHTLAFTVPGPRGGFFHASAALLPFLHTASAAGLHATINWAARRRRWNARQARAVFTVTAVILALAISGYAGIDKVSAWKAAYSDYQEVGRWLAQQEDTDRTVMVGNPPAFWYYTGYSSVVVPNDDVSTVLTVARRYNVSHVILDENHPRPLESLYAGETADAHLEPVFRYDDIVVYQVQQ